MSQNCITTIVLRLYASFSALGAVFIAVCLPETRNKTDEQIAKFFQWKCLSANQQISAMCLVVCLLDFVATIISNYCTTLWEWPNLWHDPATRTLCCHSRGPRFRCPPRPGCTSTLLTFPPTNRTSWIAGRRSLHSFILQMINYSCLAFIKI